MFLGDALIVLSLFTGCTAECMGRYDKEREKLQEMYEENCSRLRIEFSSGNKDERFPDSGSLSGAMVLVPGQAPEAFWLIWGLG